MNIKELRKSKGLTQKDLAKKSGLSFSMISKLESGEKKNPSFETLNKIADALEIKVKELLDENEYLDFSFDRTYKSQLEKGKYLIYECEDIKEIMQALAEENYYIANEIYKIKNSSKRISFIESFSKEVSEYIKFKLSQIKEGE